MDKYLSRMAADFMLAPAGYFQVSASWQDGAALSEDAIYELGNQSGIIAGGRTYGQSSSVQEFIPEDRYRSFWSGWYSPDELDAKVNNSEKLDGLLAAGADVYGMERFVLDKLVVVEGDISKLYEPGERYIAAVYLTDDYGNMMDDSHWAKVGDMINLRYVEEWEYDYEVAARVIIPYSLSYRFRIVGSDESVPNGQTFIQDTGTSAVLYRYMVSRSVVERLRETG
jgi:putative ABC transport system permease protein